MDNKPPNRFKRTNPPYEITRPLIDARDLVEVEPDTYKHNLSTLDFKVREVKEKMEAEGGIPFWKQVDVVREHEKLWRGTERVAQLIRERYPQAFEKRRKAYPPKWFTEIEKKLTSSRSIRVFSKLNNYWGYFWYHRDEKDSSLIDRELDLEVMAEHFDSTTWEIWHYREKMVRCGVLEKSKRIHSRGPKAYAIGFWNEWAEGRFTVYPLLKESLMEAIAEEFGFKELELKKRKRSERQ